MNKVFILKESWFHAHYDNNCVIPIILSLNSWDFFLFLKEYSVVREYLLNAFICTFCRLKLEALTDKDPGQLDTDSEEVEEKAEGQGGAEESLPASQPPPTTNQVLLEEEDLIIEEYISD